MDIHQKKTPTSLSTTTTLTESSDESSTNSGVFSEKETTSRNPIRALFDEFVRTREENSKPSTSIKERHCSRCTVNENVPAGAQQTLPIRALFDGLMQTGGKNSKPSTSIKKRRCSHCTINENVLTGVRQTLSKELRSKHSQELADTDSIASDEDDFVKIEHPYRDIDDLENHLMGWVEKLSLDAPEKEWKRFQDEVYEQCKLLLISLEHKEKIPANWPSVVFKKDDEVALPYQYYAQLQLVLSDFPFYDNTIEDKFSAMHPDNHLAMKLKRRISEYLGEVSKKLNLTQCYLDAFSNNTNPVFFSIGEQGSGELGLTKEDAEKLQKKFGDCIIQQISLAEKNSKLDPKTNLPEQFVLRDLPRSDYYIIDEEGETQALTRPPELIREEGESDEDYKKRLNDLGVANEKKNANVIAHVQRLSHDPRVQQKVCHYLTQDPLIGLSHGIKSELAQPLFGAGFNLLGSEGFKITFGKEDSSNKIKIRYELQRSNTRILSHVMEMPNGCNMLMSEVNERWGRSFIQLAITIVIDPENLDNVTAEGFEAHVEFPVE